jgi:hypothetical protein
VRLSSKGEASIMMPVTRRILIGLVRRAPVIPLLLILVPQTTSSPGATARGRVVAADGTPVARARVRLGASLRDKSGATGRAAVTDANGTFELRNIPAGSWRLEVELQRSKGGLNPPIVYYPGGLTWDEAVRVEFAAGQVISDLTIVVPRAAGPALRRSRSAPQPAADALGRRGLDDPTPGRDERVAVEGVEESAIVARRGIGRPAHPVVPAIR